jgi:biotin-dependent carboxylase-like uncharacterized protein
MTIEIIRAGPLTTVQDGGRPDARRFGVAPGGAMDRFAMQAANLLVGNPVGAAVLEITAGGCELRFTRTTQIALTGADLGATLDQRPVPTWVCLAISAGQQLGLSGRRGRCGARVYLAVRGGLAVPAVLGSRSTSLSGGFGGYEGRALRAGDRLYAAPAPVPTMPLVGQYWPANRRPPYRECPRLRILVGPHQACFSAATYAALFNQIWTVNPTSNRIGYRLDGINLAYDRPCRIASFGVVPGAIQVPPDGTPIILLADAQPTGGYPLIGTVISADLPLAAQLLPADRCTLTLIDRSEALAARQLFAGYLSGGPEYDDGMTLSALAGAPG